MMNEKTFEQFIDMNDNDFVLVELVYDAPVDGGIEVVCRTADTVKNIKEQLEEIEENDGTLCVGPARLDNEYSYDELIEVLRFYPISESEIDNIDTTGDSELAFNEYY